METLSSLSTVERTPNRGVIFMELDIPGANPLRILDNPHTRLLSKTHRDLVVREGVDRTLAGKIDMKRRHELVEMAQGNRRARIYTLGQRVTLLATGIFTRDGDTINLEAAIYPGDSRSKLTFTPSLAGIALKAMHYDLANDLPVAMQRYSGLVRTTPQSLPFLSEALEIAGYVPQGKILVCNSANL